VLSQEKAFVCGHCGRLVLTKFTIISFLFVLQGQLGKPHNNDVALDETCTITSVTSAKFDVLFFCYMHVPSQSINQSIDNSLPHCNVLVLVADRQATDKLASDRRESGDDLTATPFLFRKCCIAVSWSRYMAVAMQYGAPEGIHLPNRSSESSLSTNTSARMRECAPEESLGNGEEKGEEDQGKNLIDESEKDTGTEDNNSTDRKKFVFDATKRTASSFQGSTASSTTEDDQAEEMPQNLPVEKGITAWVKRQTQAIKDNKKKRLKTDPLEGIIHLDKPIVLCQEIYDKFIGNHQTSVLSKDRAIELLRQDLEQHMKEGEIDGNDYPFLAGQDEIFAQLELLRKSEDERSQSGEPFTQQKANEAGDLTNKFQDNNKDDCSADEPGNKEQPVANGETDHQLEETQRSCPQQEHVNGESENESAPQFNGDISGKGSTLTSSADDDDCEIEERQGEEDKEPLIGYWKWENTWTTHQMKMHVAKGSDLALHVVMAIIANQVRYERNAIAMTV
jgi:hypothetical protein